MQAITFIFIKLRNDYLKNNFDGSIWLWILPLRINYLISIEHGKWHGKMISRAIAQVIEHSILRPSLSERKKKRWNISVMGKMIPSLVSSANLSPSFFLSIIYCSLLFFGIFITRLLMPPLYSFTIHLIH
jgi:hypothetical protein